MIKLLTFAPLIALILLCGDAQAKIKVRRTHRQSPAKGYQVPHFAPTYECLNGKPPDTLSKKQILEEFSKGPCSPAILVPGLLSTKLVVQILDCEKLKNEFPDLFQNCGFSRCPAKGEAIDPLDQSSPAGEYVFWIPEIFSPLSIFTYKISANYCFAKFMKQNVDFSKPIEDSIVENEAYRIRLWGNTPGTKANFNCGDGAVENLLPLGSHFQSKASRAFLAMHSKLKSLGYVPGLTYQSLPYNFLKHYRNSEVNQSFKESLDRLNALTNKKVVVIGHSMGNMNILHQLNKLPTEEKAKKVQIWVAVGPVFLGAIKSNKMLISGDESLLFLKNILGLHLKPSIEGSHNAQSSYALTARCPYTLYKGQRWFDSVIARTRYEHGEIDYKDSGFAFLPPTSEKCSPPKYVTFKPDCRLGLFDTTKEPIVKILNETYYINQALEMHSRWNTTDKQRQFYEQSIDDEFTQMKNPGVPVVVYSLRTSPTMQSVEYKANVTEFNNRNIYYHPFYKTGYGDGTVPAYSALVPALKWAWEFDNKAVAGARPVKIVDMCSTYKQRDTPYDSEAADKLKSVTKNEFFGATCECMGKTNPQDCMHSNMVSDAGYLDFMYKTLITNEVGWSPAHQKYLDGLTEDYLIEVSVTCPTIKF